MENQINWTKECEKISAETVEDVCKKFVDNEEIVLYMSRPIHSGDVYGLLAQTPLNDEWNTVIVEYSIIPRREITPDKERLYKCALKNALDTANHPDVMKITDFEEYRSRISESVEWSIGQELSSIFNQTATANPDKYPIWKTHGHAHPKIDPARIVRGIPHKKFDAE